MIGMLIFGKIMSPKMSGQNYVQALMTRAPAFDNNVKKRPAPKKKKKKGERY
jgi:hypothetical protein